MTAKNKPTRILGIDYGLARIGLALSDELKIIASPLQTFLSEKKIEETVEKLVKELQAHQEKHGYVLESVVVGLPLMMNGKAGFLADEVKLFVEELKKKMAIPIMTWDERLTTVQAERSLRETNMTRKKRSQVVDKVAAVILLQNYLDHKSSNTSFH